MNIPYKAYPSAEVFSNEKKQIFKDLLSISVANYGDKDAVIVVNNVSRNLPKATTIAPITPTFAYYYACEGIPFDIEIEFQFPNGATQIVVDKAQIKEC